MIQRSGASARSRRADLGRDRPHALDIGLVLGVRHGEELRRMGQHRAADHARHHGGLSCCCEIILQTARQQADRPRATPGRRRALGFTAEQEGSSFAADPPVRAAAVLTVKTRCQEA